MEGFESLLFSVVLFWAVLHALRTLILRRRVQEGSSLPTPTTSGLRSRSGIIGSSSLRVTLHTLYLRVEFSGLNRAHDELTSTLLAGGRSKQRRYLSRFYNVGVALCCVGTLVAVGVLCWVLLQLFSALRAGANMSQAPLPPSQFEKRSLDPYLTSDVSHLQPNSVRTSVNLLIPGFTVPISHSIPLFLGLLASQIVHEFGHALAAALEVVPMLSTGIAVHLLLPSAFVALPAVAVQQLSPRARLRVIGAGPFHNLVLWLFLRALSLSGIGSLLLSVIGYKAIGHYGRAVVDISADSPLRMYIPTGAIITKLNDMPLTSSDPSADLWTTYLSRPRINATQELGWCTDKVAFMIQPDACCMPDHRETELSCFTAPPSSSPKPRIQKCISPLSLVDLDNPLSTKRCRIAPDCQDSQLCVRPRPDEELLRITLWIPDPIRDTGPGDSGGSEKIVMWSGPSGEVLEEVEVSRRLPRFRFLPVSFPAFTENCFKYLSTLTLSLYLFNLLPLPYLDGEQFLRTLLDMSVKPSDEFVSLEAGTRIPRTGSVLVGRNDWKQRVSKACQAVVSSLIILCILLGGVLSLQ